jgi:hypothetical protein
MIPTEDLKARREVIVDQPSVQPIITASLLSLFSAVVVDMIDGKERGIGNAANCTLTTITGKDEELAFLKIQFSSNPDEYTVVYCVLSMLFQNMTFIIFVIKSGSGVVTVNTYWIKT